MQKFSKFAALSNSTRGCAAKAKVTPSQVHSDVSEEGIKICSIDRPSTSSGVSRVALVVRGGPVYEHFAKLGLSHLIRRSFGLASDHYTAVNLNRHLESMGAKANVTGTKEHLIYTIDCAPNLAPRAGELLSFMASDNAYYPWEVKRLTKKLMAYDIEYLNRIDGEALCSELLHEAAFGSHHFGTKLGRSLYSSMDKLGEYTEEDIFNFHESMFSATNMSIGLLNTSKDLDSLDLIKEFKDCLKISNKPEKVPAPQHTFIGNDIRREVNNQSHVNVKLAYYVPSGRSNPSQLVAMSIASRALGVNRVLYGTHKDSILGRSAGAEGHEESLVTAQALFQPHTAHSLFGVSLRGTCGQATNARLNAIFATLKELATKGLDQKDFEKGKALALMDYYELMENPFDNIVENAVDNLENGKVNTFDEMTNLINNATLEDVNNHLKKVLSAGHRAMAVTGRHTSVISPLAVLPK